MFASSGCVSTAASKFPITANQLTCALMKVFSSVVACKAVCRHYADTEQIRTRLQLEHQIMIASHSHNIAECSFRQTLPGNSDLTMEESATH